MKEYAEALFGDDNVEVFELEDASNTLDGPTILEFEVEKRLRNMKNCEAPGDDRIPTEAVK